LVKKLGVEPKYGVFPGLGRGPGIKTQFSSGPGPKNADMQVSNICT